MTPHRKHMLLGLALAFGVSLFGCAQSEAAPRHHRKHGHHRFVPRDANGNRVIGGRPDGCPRAFCGCGLRKYLGLDDVRLNLAAAWFRFPRSHPMPGAVAVRRHHVFLLKQHIKGSVWLALDYNSGGHLTRLHARSISGFTIVDPGAYRSAGL